MKKKMFLALFMSFAYAWALFLARAFVVWLVWTGLAPTLGAQHLTYAQVVGIMLILAFALPHRERKE